MEFTANEAGADGQTADTLTPDTAQMAEHLDKLFGWATSLYQNGLIELAFGTTRADGSHTIDRAELYPITAEWRDKLITRAAALNSQGRNVYVGINLRRAGTVAHERASDDAVEISKFVVAEIDRPEGLEALKALRPPYSFAVTTGRTPSPRVHAYWELEEPTSDWAVREHVQKLLKKCLDGDAVGDRSRILRLAGSISWPSPKKAAKGYIVEPVTIRTKYPEERMPTTLGALETNVLATTPRRKKKAHGAEEPQQEVPPRSEPNFDTSSVNAAELIAKIQRQEENWHDDVRTLTAHLVNLGISDAALLLMAEGLTWRGYTVEQTRTELKVLIDGARRSWNIPNDEMLSGTDAIDLIAPRSIAGLDPRTIPPRPWVFGDWLLRQCVTEVIAAPGLNKTSLILHVLLAVAAGASWAGLMTHDPGPVWFYNNEEPPDELDRRVYAALAEMRIPFDQIRDRVFINSGANYPLLVARYDRHGNVIRLPHVDASIAYIRERGIRVFGADPFVEMHELEENNNVDIRKAAGMFREIAQRADCAVILAHHTNKPPLGKSDLHIGNLNSGRGGSSRGGVVRVSRTVFGMTEVDAEELGVADDQRYRYVRCDEAKANLTLNPPGAIWFERVSQTLPNGSGLRPGDQVGALRPVDFTDQAKKAAAQRHVQEEERRAREAARDIERLAAVAKIIPIGEAMSTNALAQRLIEAEQFEADRTARRWINDKIPEAPQRVAIMGGGELFRRRAGNASTSPIEVVHE
jgi:hypothetical protein